jgi:hypothetical protein
LLKKRCHRNRIKKERKNIPGLRQLDKNILDLTEKKQTSKDNKLDDKVKKYC